METIDYASELSSFFNAHRGIPVSIEYYPPGSPLLTSGPNIAIPKSHLIGAFSSAFATFNALIPAAPWGAEDARALLDATLILILVAAEHTTAVNTRRRILKLGLGDHVVTPRDEIKLLEGILTSHLAKHNKSPSLWYYRRWIVETYGVEVLGEGGIKEELEVVRKSGGAHPRNYYAWSYARFTVDKLYSADGPQPGKGGALPPPLRELIESHAVLCRTHVSDTSFWSFLLFLFYKALEEEEPLPGGCGHGYAYSITKEAAIYAHDIARGHESVWVFVRTVIVDGRLLEKAQQEELIGMVENWVQEGGEGGEGEAAGNKDARDLELGLEKKALRWISRRSTSTCSSKVPLAAAGSGEVHVIAVDI